MNNVREVALARVTASVRIFFIRALGVNGLPLMMPIDPFHFERKNEKGLAGINQLARFIVKADGRIRTADLLITNQLLCQLSYVGLVEKGNII